MSYTDLISRIERRFNSPENPVLNPEGVPPDFYGVDGNNFSVSDKQALALSVVYSAIRIPAEDLASLTLGVYQKDKGFYQPVDHPLNYLLQVKASSYQTAFQWKESTTASVGARGNSFSFINQRGSRITALEYLDDTEWDVEVIKDSKGRPQVRYVRTVGDKKTDVLTADQVIHIPFTSFYGSAKSLSPIEWLKDSIRYSLNSLEYGNNIMRHGQFGSGFLETDHELSDEAAARISASMSRNYGGSRGAGKMPVLEGGIKFKPARLSPSDAQFILSRKFEVEDLLRPFRVPAHMVNHLENATFNNVTEMALGYIKFCLLPWSKRWESELNCKLLSEKEYSQGLRIRYNLDDLLKGDIKTQTSYLKAMVSTGIMTRAEAREFLGLRGIEGTDELIIPQNIFGDPTDKKEDYENEENSKEDEV